MIVFRFYRTVSHPRRLNGACRLIALLLLAGFMSPARAEDPSTAGSPAVILRVGFTSTMFTEVNENDVRAAMKVWAQTLLKDQGLSVDPNVTMLNGAEEISRSLRDKRIDAFGITAEEYWSTQKEMQASDVVLALFDGRITEEYVLAVHRESGIERIGDLRGRSINVFVNPRMSLATTWLDTFLIQTGMDQLSEHFGRVTHLNKLPKVVLPVFFRQNDACLVTRRGLQTMSELNPQVGQKLKVIASSPELVPIGFFFRGGFSKSAKKKAYDQFVTVHTTPAGQQALAVFQSGTLEIHPISVMRSALDVIEKHKRLCAAHREVKPPRAGPQPKEAWAGDR